MEFEKKKTTKKYLVDYLFRSHLPLYKNLVSTDDPNMSLPVLRLLQCWPPNDEVLSEASSNHAMNASTTAALILHCTVLFLIINFLDIPQSNSLI